MTQSAHSAFDAFIARVVDDCVNARTYPPPCDHDWQVGESGPQSYGGSTSVVATCADCGKTETWGEGEGVL